MKSPSTSLFGLFLVVAALGTLIAAAEAWNLWPRVANLLGIEYNTLIVLVGTSLLGASAGLVGSFAVLRRQALMGDALSHAALPGICLAFMWRGQRDLPALLTGALLTGLLGICLVAGLRRWTRIKEDAAIGIVLSVFFGAGVSLSRLIQQTTTTGSKAGLDSYILGKTAGMISQDVTWIAGVSLFSLLVVLLCYKEFKLAAFDSGFASAQGWPALVLDLTMMGLVAVTVVLGLPVVGVVLMAALLILPGAAARFWTDRLGRMLLLSALFGTLVGGIGTSLSARYSGMPAGPIIVLVGTAVFLVSVLFAPRRGGVARLIAVQSMRQKIQEQKLLRQLLESGETVPPGSQRRLASLARRGLVESTAGGRYRLTEAGSARAAQIARAHRLWQRFLERNPEMIATLVDLDADAIEEQLSPETIRGLEAQP